MENEITKMEEKNMPFKEAGRAITIQTLVSDLMERNMAAWLALPLSLKSKLLETPTRFRFAGGEKAGSVPNIIINGVEIHYYQFSGGNTGYWSLVDVQ